MTNHFFWRKKFFWRKSLTTCFRRNKLFDDYFFDKSYIVLKFSSGMEKTCDFGQNPITLTITLKSQNHGITKSRNHTHHLVQSHSHSLTKFWITITPKSRCECDCECDYVISWLGFPSLVQLVPLVHQLQLLCENYIILYLLKLFKCY